jgi:hypothetical protein
LERALAISQKQKTPQSAGFFLFKRTRYFSSGPQGCPQWEQPQWDSFSSEPQVQLSIGCPQPGHFSSIFLFNIKL